MNLKLKTNNQKEMNMLPHVQKCKKKSEFQKCPRQLVSGNQMCRSQTYKTEMIYKSL